MIKQHTVSYDLQTGDSIEIDTRPDRDTYDSNLLEIKIDVRDNNFEGKCVILTEKEFDTLVDIMIRVRDVIKLK